MEETLKILQLLARDRDLCFHGTKRPLHELTPQQATCGSGKPANTQLAVYATRDDVAIAIVMALFDRVPHVQSSRSGYSRTSNGPLIVTGENATFTPGFVLVLPTKTFSDFEGEYISRVPVMPIALVSVTPHILRFMDNIELHVPIPSPY